MSEFTRSGAGVFETGAGRCFVKSPHDGSYTEIDIKSFEIAWETARDSDEQVFDLTNFNTFTASGSFTVKDVDPVWRDQLFAFYDRKKEIEKIDIMRDIRALAYERMPLLSLYPEMN